MKKFLLTMLKIIIFIVLLLSLVLNIGKALIPKWYDEWNNTPIILDFYKLPKNSVDVLAIGSSQIIKGFSPLELYKNYGISSYGIGTEGQHVGLSYYWLKEALRSQKPKVVLYEVMLLFSTTSDEQYMKALDNMQLSPVKLEAITKLSLIDRKSYKNFIDLMFPITYFHSRWQEVLEQDPAKDFQKLDNYLGYAMKNDRSGLTTYKCLDKTNKEEAVIEEDRLEYLNKMIKLCQKEGIELVLFHLPNYGCKAEEYNAVAKIADENNLKYIDFNDEEYYNLINFNFADDVDRTAHLNIQGAEKCTNYLGKYLTEKYTFEDRRQDSKYDHLDKILEKYNLAVENAKIVNIFDAGKYIETAYNGDFTIIFVKNKAAIQDNEQFRQTMGSIGLDYDKTVKNNYYAVFENGVKIAEDASDTDILRYEKDLSENDKLTISTEGNGSIKINDVEHSLTNFGFNAVLYNNKTSEFVESVNLDFKDGFLVIGR